jgi:hypothetical protein
MPESLLIPSDASCNAFRTVIETKQPTGKPKEALEDLMLDLQRSCLCVDGFMVCCNYNRSLLPVKPTKTPVYTNTKAPDVRQGALC